MLVLHQANCVGDEFVPGSIPMLVALEDVTPLELAK